MKPNASISVLRLRAFHGPGRLGRAQPLHRRGVRHPGRYPGPAGQVDDRDHPAVLDVELPAALARVLDHEVAQEPGGRPE